MRKVYPNNARKDSDFIFTAALEFIWAGVANDLKDNDILI